MECMDSCAHSCFCVDMHNDFHMTDLANFSNTETVQGSHLLNDVAAGIHFVPTGVAEGGELGNKAGMCSGCEAAGG